MRKTDGILKGGFYTSEFKDGKRVPKAIMGKVDVINPFYLLHDRREAARADGMYEEGDGTIAGIKDAYGSNDRVLMEHIISCGVDDKLMVSSGKMGTPLEVSMNTDSILLYGVPIPDKMMNEEGVYRCWVWLSSKGVDIRGSIGLYGYYFNNSKQAFYDREKEVVDARTHAAYASDKFKNRFHANSTADDDRYRGHKIRFSSGPRGGVKERQIPVESYHDTGRVWYAGYAFSRCSRCNKWRGKEVIQEVGKKESYLCPKCKEPIDFTITDDVFVSHNRAGLVKDMVSIFAVNRLGNRRRSISEIYTRMAYHKKVNTDIYGS